MNGTMIKEIIYPKSCPHKITYFHPQYISLSICLWVDPFEGQANSQNLGMQKPISKMFWGWKNEQFLCHPLMGRDFSLIFFLTIVMNEWKNEYESNANVYVWGIW